MSRQTTASSSRRPGAAARVQRALRAWLCRRPRATEDVPVPDDAGGLH